MAISKEQKEEIHPVFLTRGRTKPCLPDILHIIEFFRRPFLRCVAFPAKLVVMGFDLLKGDDRAIITDCDNIVAIAE